MLRPCQVFAVLFTPIAKIILRNFKHFLKLTKFSLLEDVSVLTPHVSLSGLPTSWKLGRSTQISPHAVVTSVAA